VENLKPDISILLPVRQWRDTTLASVVSVLNQTCDSVEVLIIGQHDVHTLKQRLPVDNRLRFIARDKPGIVSALNTGLANARAPYIARMDDDDIAHAQRFQTQLAYLREYPEIDLCATRIRFIDQFGNSDNIGLGNLEYGRWLNSLTTATQIRHACFVESPLPHPTLLAHRDVWNRLGGYRDLDGPEDYDLILRAMLHKMNMGKPEQVLLDWREHAQRLTYTDSRYRREAFTQRRVWAAVQSRSGLGLDKGRSVWLCGTGRNARYWFDGLAKAGVTIRGFVDIRRDGPQRYKRGLPVTNYEELPDKRGDSLIITAITQPSGRAQLLSYFQMHDWQSGKDYILGG